MPLGARERQVTASSNQTLSTTVTCLTRPSRVLRGEPANGAPVLGESVEAFVERCVVLVEEHLELGSRRFVDETLDPRRTSRGKDTCGAYPNRRLRLHAASLCLAARP